MPERLNGLPEQNERQPESARCRVGERGQKPIRAWLAHKCAHDPRDALDPSSSAPQESTLVGLSDGLASASLHRSNGTFYPVTPRPKQSAGNQYGRGGTAQRRSRPAAHVRGCRVQKVASRRCGPCAVERALSLLYRQDTRDCTGQPLSFGGAGRLAPAESNYIQSRTLLGKGRSIDSFETGIV